jgi:hypothetical protein
LQQCGQALSRNSQRTYPGKTLSVLAVSENLVNIKSFYCFALLFKKTMRNQRQETSQARQPGTIARLPCFYVTTNLSLFVSFIGFD